MPKDRIDPRAARTRHLLLESFRQLKFERGSIRSVSVLDIAERAGVNRATFYAHFKDKYELLNAWTRKFYKEYVKERLPEDSRLNAETLRILIGATLDVLELHNQYRSRVNKEFEPVLDGALQEELLQTLTLMSEGSGYATSALRFLSWAIFGSANDWVRTGLRPKEAAAKELFSLAETFLKERGGLAPTQKVSEILSKRDG